MARRRRIWLAILGAVALIPIALLLTLSIYWKAKFVPSEIIDFRPVPFHANASTPFFYSIGDELKYSDEIDPAARTLASGEIKEFLVSPDNKKIAIVANDVLSVVTEESPSVRQVSRVDSIWRESKPLGQQFFRDDYFQWSKDSRYLYVIKDKFYASKGVQLYSENGELWRYEIETGNLGLVLKPFRASTYFFSGDSGVYFSVPTSDGNLQLRYFDGKSVYDVSIPDAEKEIPASALPTADERLFFSFSINDYERAVLPAKSVRLEEVQQGGPQRLLIGTKSYLSFKKGEGLKGPHYCSELLRSVLLPGEKYFLLQVGYCANYQGQLLIDVDSGQYTTLPRDTRVYITLNTDTYPNYYVTAEGIKVSESARE